MARHEHFHKALGRFVAFLTLYHDFLNIAIVDVADGALDKIAIRMHQRWRGRGKGLLPDLVP